MKYKIILLFITAQLISFIAATQNQNCAKNRLALKANYFGEFILHPGFSIGTDFTLIDKNIIDVHWDSEIGSYFHKWNNNSLFVQSTIGTRFTSSFSAFIDLNFGLGYMLSTPNGETFVVAEDGTISKKGRPFTSHFKPNISFLIGWDFVKKTEIPILFQAGIEAYWQSHFNHTFLLHAALKIGIVYKLQLQK